MSSVIIIPSRMGSTRLPNKPLVDINGEPMIVQVWRRAMEADIAPVIVACDSKEIVEAIEAVNGVAVLTPPELASGSDRIHVALNIVDKNNNYDKIINLQGDLPTIEPKVIKSLVEKMSTTNADLITLGVKEYDLEKKSLPQVVKAIVAFNDETQGKALYFTRAAAPTGSDEFIHHVGIYGWRRESLNKFVLLPQSKLEKLEKLEQLRALENNMTIELILVDTIPVGVDVYEDLELARAIVKNIRTI